MVTVNGSVYALNDRTGVSTWFAPAIHAPLLRDNRTEETRMLSSTVWTV